MFQHHIWVQATLWDFLRLSAQTMQTTFTLPPCHGVWLPPQVLFRSGRLKPPLNFHSKMYLFVFSLSENATSVYSYSDKNLSFFFDSSFFLTPIQSVRKSFQLTLPEIITLNHFSTLLCYHLISQTSIWSHLITVITPSLAFINSLIL